jgi:hypothetical protein
MLFLPVHLGPLKNKEFFLLCFPHEPPEVKEFSTVFSHGPSKMLGHQKLVSRLLPRYPTHMPRVYLRSRWPPQPSDAGTCSRKLAASCSHPCPTGPTANTRSRKPAASHSRPCPTGPNTAGHHAVRLDSLARFWSAPDAGFLCQVTFIAPVDPNATTCHKPVLSPVPGQPRRHHRLSSSTAPGIIFNKLFLIAIYRQK